MTEQKEVFFPKSRFWKETDAWATFLKEIVGVVSNSREKTESEKRIQKIEENIARMIVAYSRPDETGDDPKSIARERISFLEQKVQKELKEREVACVRSEVESLKKLLRKREARLNELNADKSFGSMRQSEIDEARAKIAQAM